MAGNLLVVGDWLPYQILDENGIFVRRTSLEDLTTNIKWAIDNYLSMQETLKKNQAKMYQLSSWKYVSEKWANIYQELA
jgi:glycosyltransferase involved in cell wall biosynthesis